MTLKEAYELQKKELFSLRRELEQFRKSSFPLKEKEDLEKELRKAGRRYDALQKRFDELVRTHLADMEEKKRLSDEFSEAQSRCVSLTRQNDRLILELETAKAELDSLREDNQRLNVRIHKDHTNSSLPSSAVLFRKKIHNSRKPSGRKPGGQTGHRGHGRKVPEAAHTETILLAAPACTTAPETARDYYKTGKEIHRREVDIHVEVRVTDYVAEEYRCRSTGARIHAPFPAGIHNEMNYGQGLKALAFLLNNYCNVPIRKVQEFVSYVTDGLVVPSVGMISSLCASFSARTKTERAKIFLQLVDTGILYTDATVGNVNGRRKAVFVNTDKDCALYQACEGKGLEGVAGTPAGKNRNTLVHDHDKTFYHFGNHHQECLAHVLRYLKGSIENEPELQWNKKMEALITEMIRFAKKHPERRDAKDGTVREFRKRYRELLKAGIEEYKEHPPSEGFREGYNLCKRMLEYMDAHLYFLSDPRVDWTNNLSERALRKVKRKQRQAVGFRSMSGLGYYCDALTILETARMRHQNPFQAVKTAF